MNEYHIHLVISARKVLEISDIYQYLQKVLSSGHIDFNSSEAYAFLLLFFEVTLKAKVLTSFN